MPDEIFVLSVAIGEILATSYTRRNNQLLSKKYAIIPDRGCLPILIVS